MTTTRFLSVDKMIHRASIYRNACGLDVFVHESTGQIVLRTGTVGAIELPCDVGHRVVHALACRARSSCTPTPRSPR